MKRYLVLDAFRGLTIAAMILVNMPGSWDHVYAPLRHSTWHGCTPTDLIFPFFLFIVGVSMWFSFMKFDNKPTSRLIKKVLKRTAIMFLIGFLLNAFPWIRDYSTVRIMGVLQRIALAYGLAALLCLYLNRSRLGIASILIKRRGL